MIYMVRSFALTLVFALYSQSSIAEVSLEYGEYLASECTSCHLLSGKESNIPSIIDWDPESFIAVLTAYKDKELESKVMQNIATRLGADEMTSLAQYFATIKPKEDSE